MNFIVYNISFISIEIIWDLIFLYEKYKVISVYFVILICVDYFSDMEKYNVILSICGNVIKMIIFWINLCKYMVYRIIVVGVIDGGFGKVSDEIIVLIDEDGKNIIIKCIDGVMFYIKIL